MGNVLVLNADYSFMGMISWQRSVVLMYQNKVETIKETDTVVYNTDKSISYIIPKIIRLVKYVTQVFKNKIPYSKSNVFIRDNYSCGYCGVKMKTKDCTVDHIIPRCKGGKTTWVNIVTACKRCNNQKDDKDLYDTHLRLRCDPVAPSVSEFMRKKSQTIVENIGDYLKDL